MIPQVKLFLFVFLKNWRHQKDILKLTDLYITSGLLRYVHGFTNFYNFFHYIIRMNQVKTKKAIFFLIGPNLDIRYWWNHIMNCLASEILGRIKCLPNVTMNNGFLTTNKEKILFHLAKLYWNKKQFLSSYPVNNK